MNSNKKNIKDYYSILGVLPSIEANALDAVYKALIKKYHPDIYKGDKKFAEEKTKELNEAYSVLRDADKRKKYDEERQKENKGFGSFEQENSFDGNNEILIEQLKNDWKIVIEFYPEAEKFREDLNKISEALAFTYQVIIIDTQNGSNSFKIKNQMKFQYLKSYFGEDNAIQSFAEKLIKTNQKEAAIYLNSVIRVLGSPRNLPECGQIIENVKTKYKIDTIISKKNINQIKSSQYINPLYIFLITLLMTCGFIFAFLAMKH